MCRVPPSSTCLPADQSTSVGQASIKVERWEMRMMLMEAELASLKQDKVQLQQELNAIDRSMTQKVRAEVGQLTQQLNTEVDQLTNQLNTEVGQMKQQFNRDIDQLKQHFKSEVGQLTQQLNTEVGQLTQQAVDINQTLIKRCSDLEAIQQRDKASMSRMIQGGCSCLVVRLRCR